MIHDLPYIFQCEKKCRDEFPCVLVVTTSNPPDVPRLCPYQEGIEPTWVKLGRMP
jgi:hypothetical protein